METASAPLFLLSKFCAVNPINFTKRTGSYIRTFYTILILSLYFGSSIFGFHGYLIKLNDSLINEDNYEGVTKYYLELLFYTLACINVLGMSFFVFTKGQDLDNILHIIEEESKNIGCDREMYRFLFWKSVSFACTVCVSSTTLCVTEVVMLPMDFFSVMGNLIVFVMGFAMSLCVEMQVLLTVTVQAFILKVINSKLQHCGSLTDLETVERLRRSHARVCEACSELGSVFSAPLLTGLALSVGLLLISMYLLVITSLGISMLYRHVLLRFTAVATLWTVLTYLRLLHLAVRGDLAAAQTRETLLVIEKLLFTIVHPLLEEEVLLFRENVLHHPLGVSVFRMFALDLTLLKSVNATLVTHLVTVLQFHLLTK